MHIYSKNQVSSPIDHGYGEKIYEILGRDFDEKTENHSVAHVLIAPRKSSRLHLHPVAEESYYILSGKARVQVGEEESIVSSGQIILIPPGKSHKIENIGEEALEFLAICVPAWQQGNTKYLE
jgi:mannose-6-phosphate isomerase-like protein (cupin superfamily)